MGKKSKEPVHETSEAIKSLFSENNPFRRKTEPQPQPAPAPSEPGLGSPPPANDNTAVAADEKKRKREKKLENPNANTIPNRSPNPTPSTPGSIRKKRKKEENEEVDGENSKKSTKKRKRDEVEAEYEKRKYGEIADTEEVAVSVGKKRKAKDIAATEIADEGFDDESKLLRTVFVGNLPLKIKKKVLMKEFEKFGEIESVRIRSVPLVDSKTPRKGAIIKGKFNEAVGRVNAYIVFSNEQSAQAALSNNMSVIGENHIRVDMACPPRKKLKGETPLYERKKTVFLGNLPFDVKDEEIYQLLCGPNPSESNVEAVRVVRDPQTSLGRGIAYVLFKTRDAANSICKRGDLKIRDRTLRVCHAKLETTPSKRVDYGPSKRKDAGPRRDSPRKKFAATSNERSPGKDKPKPAAASLSYQGLRSSKSGVVKKSGLHLRPSGGHGDQGTKKASVFDKQANKAKRPAVAARKVKMMKKRKLENGTPEGTHRNKKGKRQ